MSQYHCIVSEKQKTRRLVEILDILDFKQVAIFTRTKERAYILNNVLSQIAFPTVCIHGDMEQSERFRKWICFKEYKYRILVATNLFGRGIDLEKVNCVINYDMCQSDDEYLHRVGRVSRSFENGTAITFVTTEQEKQVMEKIQQRFA
eukprot:389541_1